MMKHVLAEKMRILGRFIGSWETNGAILADSSNAPATFGARDTYSWQASGYILLHQFDADMPHGKIEGIKIIGGNLANRFGRYC